MDGKTKDGSNKKSFDGAAKIEIADLHLVKAAGILQGLDPATSRSRGFARDRLAIVGHRISDLFVESRYTMVRKFLHPSNPFEKIPKGHIGYDNMSQMATPLKNLAKDLRPGVKFILAAKVSVDEETHPFQGPSAELKQNCGKFKAAGDGLQNDVVCMERGIPLSMALRGHSLLPTVTIKGQPNLKLSDLHQRVVWCFYLAEIKTGNEVGMDNLYNSFDFSHMCEADAIFVINEPPGWMASLVNTDGSETAVTVEYAVKGVHHVGTLRGNRGSEVKHQGPKKMGTKAVRELKKKPLVPDRVKIRVTDDEAQVITVAIFDKKWFQMIDTIHTEITEQTKTRKVFDRAKGKPGKKEVPITNTQNAYNHGMGFVDLDDLIAWFYRNNLYHEFKFWWPLKLWIDRKRPDLAYRAYQIRVHDAKVEAQDKLDKLDSAQLTTAGQKQKMELQQTLKQLERDTISHFDFLESAAGYHIVEAHNSLFPTTPLNSMEWRKALEQMGRRSNAQLRLNRKARVLAGAGPPRVRGNKWPSDESQWPAERLTGQHQLAMHPSGQHFCDLPGCLLQHSSFSGGGGGGSGGDSGGGSSSTTKKQKGTPKPATRSQTPKKPPKPATRSQSAPPSRRTHFGDVSGRATPESGRASPFFEVTGEKAKGGKTRLFCKCCFDPDDKRCMNFHPECWNKWHFKANEAEGSSSTASALLSLAAFAPILCDGCDD